MRYCHKCGKELEDSVRFCVYCGIEQHSNAVKKEERIDDTKKNTNKSIVVVVSVAIVIIIGVISLFALKKSLVKNNGKSITSETEEKVIMNEDNKVYENNEEDTGTTENVSENTNIQDIEDTDKYYYGTYYETPNWYQDDKVVVKNNEIIVSLGTNVWANSTVPSYYWFIFEDGFLQESAYCLYLKDSNCARAACKNLSENFNEDGVNAMRKQKGEETYYFMDNVLIISEPGTEFEDMFGKYYYDITMDDIINYFSSYMYIDYDNFLENDNATDDYILPTSDSEKLTRADIENLSLQEINYAKNEIYARHGRRFKSKELQNYFDSKSWYSGTIAPNDFDESVLSKIEKANVKLLVDEEFSIDSNGYQLDK